MVRALTLALTLLAVLALAAPALGSPAHRDAVLGSTDEWIGSVLRVPVPDRIDLPGQEIDELAPGEAAVPCAPAGEARYGEGLLDSMGDRLDLFFEAAWSVALHEHLHHRGGPCVYSATSPRPDRLDPAWLYFEEGLVDAVRVDLFPAYFRAQFGRRPAWPAAPMSRYADNVRTVRALSRLATGSPSWRDRNARLWRRAALLADWPARQALIAAGNARSTA